MSINTPFILYNMNKIELYNFGKVRNKKNKPVENGSNN